MLTSHCSSCGELFPSSDNDVSATLEAISRTASKGCESCVLIQQSVHDCVPEALTAGNDGVTIIVRQAIMRNFIEVVVKWSDEQVTLDLFVEDGSACPWPLIRVGTPTAGRSIARAAFQLTGQWIQDCLKNHQACNATSKSALPHRILDLQTAGEDVRLCEPHKLYERYICLSHCWGDSRTVTTTTENIADFRARIPFTSLPRTFQEAIIFARKLGVNYLWIDSLPFASTFESVHRTETFSSLEGSSNFDPRCIIQDSEDDWQRQSAEMSKIFQNSYITLAATGAKADNEGLFFSHPTSALSGTSGKTGHDYVVHVRPVIAHGDEAHFPLFKRAWVYQERLLAPRVLHFGRQELWWECLENVACECGGIFGDRYGTGQEKFLSKLTHQEALSRDDLTHVRRRWHSIVEEYSQLNLSKMRDKLPALSGIAEQISHLRQGEYLAGTWGDTLALDLLWYRRDPLTGVCMDKWRSPSWSWASTDGPIRYFDAPNIQDTPSIGTSTFEAQVPTLSSSFVSIAEAISIRLSGNAFGEVKSLHLKIRGPVTAVSVSDSRSLSSRTLQRRRHYSRFRLSQYQFRFERSDSTSSFPFFADHDLHMRDNMFAESRYVILRVGIDDGGAEYALLLKCLHVEQGICERIGLFTTKFSPWPSLEHTEVYYAAFVGDDALKDLTLV